MDDTLPTSAEKRKRAPSREEIGRIVTLAELWIGLSDAEDKCISLQTQLEYLEEGPELHRSRVGALIWWKIAVKNYKNHANALKGELKRSKDQPLPVQQE